MKWIKTHEPKLSENYLEIHYGSMNKETEDIINYLESKNVLVGRNEGESRLIQPSEVYYCETVDRKCYAYLKDEVWKLEEALPILLLMLLQYVVLIGCVMGAIWIGSHFMDITPNGYREMFWSVTIPYVVLAGSYYISFFWEVKKANAMLSEMNREEVRKVK